MRLLVCTSHLMANRPLVMQAGFVHEQGDVGEYGATLEATQTGKTSVQAAEEIQHDSRETPGQSLEAETA